jgi:FAD/FMN-containing dehydrogenase
MAAPPDRQAATERSLRLAPRRVDDGFGFAVRAVSPYVKPRDADEVAAIFARATAEGVTVGMRGNGRSYGDAALNAGGVVMDTTGLDRVLSFDPSTGIVEVEPGVTIAALWRHALPHGWWPAVVPGTMMATLGGCAAMNVHGKNHFKVGGTGDSILDADLVTPAGERLLLSRTSNPDLFAAAIGGFGMLGTLTRLRLQMKHVYSGNLRVRQIPARSLDEQFAIFEREIPGADYLVSWTDCVVGGAGLGRGQVHAATYLPQGEDKDPARLLDPAKQDLPPHILGVPRSLVGPVLGFLTNNPCMRLLNIGKYYSSLLGPKSPYLQGHAAFAFLLDYVPNWRSAYEPGGFIQFQPFVPKESAKHVFSEILRRTQARGMPSYLGVMKRHRADDFLLSHALDGYSLAMDYPVTRANRAELWKLCGELADLVLDHGGRFYPAKDLVLRPQDFRRAWGQDRIGRFRALRRRVDPAGVLSTQWAARVGVDDAADG